MRAPLVSAHGETNVRRLVYVRLVAGDGVSGLGEAAPLPAYDGVSEEDVLGALRRWDPDGPLPELPQAAAAVDLALWDLRGRRAGEPVWRLLGAGDRDPPGAIEVNATIGAVAAEAAGRAARAARRAGFTCVKVKVGVGDDLARVRAVREGGGPQMAIRLDANGAWSVEEALATLSALAPLGLELCEEPVHGAAALRRVADGSPVRVAADESAGEVLTAADGSVGEPGLARRAGAAVCLKIAASGGISGVLRDAERARAAGYEVYLASTLDGPLGIAAALHAAAVLRPDRSCGLATLGLLGLEDALPVLDGRMAVPRDPGLGGWSPR